MKFQFGIEHEVAFLRPDGAYADFDTMRFEEFEAIVEALPYHKTDYPRLRVGEVGIKVKRWYIEGYERFSEDGQLLDCPPKGIELRTTPQSTIRETIAELVDSYELLKQAANRRNFQPTWISFNPFKTAFVPNPPLNAYERKMRSHSPESVTATLHMLTQGPDINISLSGMTDAELIDVGQKLTFYSPFLVPFSFSSPFYKGERWAGYSARTYYRTGARPAALVFLHDKAHHIPSQPSLTQESRIDYEQGRIEYKAFDTCQDQRLYAAFLALMKGLVLEKELTGRSLTPSTELHQRVAQTGFDDVEIIQQTQAVLTAVRRVLADDDQQLLAPLHDMVDRRRTPAHDMIDAYEREGSIEGVLHAYANYTL